MKISLLKFGRIWLGLLINSFTYPQKFFLISLSWSIEFIFSLKQFVFSLLTFDLNNLATNRIVATSVSVLLCLSRFSSFFNWDFE